MDIGVFDHLDRRDVPLVEFYESRLRLLEKYDAAATQRTRRIRLGPCAASTVSVEYPEVSR
jgi:hypothetical protein